MRLSLGLILFALGSGAAGAQSAALAPMPGLAAPAASTLSGDAALAPLDLAASPLPDERSEATAATPALPLAPLPATVRTAAMPASNAAAKPVTPHVSSATSPTSQPRQLVPPTQLAWSAPQHAGAALAPLPEPEANALARVTTTFAIRQGETLQAALTRWCSAAGWTLVWKSTRDYRIEAAITFPSGTAFDEAVHDTMRSIWRMSPTVKSTLYTRNRVLLLSEVNG